MISIPCILYGILLLACALAQTIPSQIVLDRAAYDVGEAANVARTLMNRESLADINTIAEYDGALVPISSMEYYADCDNDGDPYWLALEIGLPMRNINAGSAFSWSIRVGDHAPHERVNTTYPGTVSQSPAGSPRAIYEGTIAPIKFSSRNQQEELEACFLDRHPDAKWWLPEAKNSPHKSSWMKFTVNKVHFIGGFGDRAYIGVIDSDTYHSR